MRVLLQLVQHASVDISRERVASTQKGYLLFVGFTQGDDLSLAKKMAEKICKLRVFPDDTGKTNRSLSDVGGNILSVSQFTLRLREGREPPQLHPLPEQGRSQDALRRVLRLSEDLMP